MVDLDEIRQPIRERLEQIAATELVIGILAPDRKGEPGRVVSTVRESIAMLSTPVRVVTLYADPLTDRGPGKSEPAADDEALHLLPYPFFAQGEPPDLVETVPDAYRALFAVSDQLGSRACTAIASNFETVTPLWIYRLFQPVLELGFDAVTPCYAHRISEGLLNTSIIAPLTRALYGKRIQHPLGPDFGFSSRLLRRFLSGGPGVRAASHARPLVSLATEALKGFEICQAHVGVRIYPPTDWTNLSSVLAQILGPLFHEIERNATLWQRIRGSESIAEFGESPHMGEKNSAIDVQRMIESFQLGCRSLQEVWGIVLPPATLLELNKLARLAPDQFRMGDDLWARIVYDFALGHRLRTISEDHLLRAMTPLYLAWVVSYVLTLESSGEPAEQRFEHICMAYESVKPYFLSRWRWPDRFNP